VIIQLEQQVSPVSDPVGVSGRPAIIAAHRKQRAQMLKRLVLSDACAVRRRVWPGQIPQFIGGRSVVEDRFHWESIADVRHLGDCAVARSTYGHAVRGTGGDKGVPLPQNADWAKARKDALDNIAWFQALPH